MRQIVLDTETTGLEADAGHRIIEIACLELVERRITGDDFHRYLNPGRKSDPRAFEVHRITDEFLRDKPVFADVCDDFLRYVADAEIIIHNAAFDLAFINAELRRLDAGAPDFLKRTGCTLRDSLELARTKFPGLQNNLDALSDRFSIDRSSRNERHGAMIDAELLAKVYLALTGGQTAMSFGGADTAVEAALPELGGFGGGDLPVISADAGEVARHRRFLKRLARESRAGCVWPEA